MPPLAIVGTEVSALHRGAEHEAVVFLLRRHRPGVRPRTLIEKIKRRAHVDFFAGLQIDQGEINRTAPRVTRKLRDLTLAE